jgi:hypothetical protein
MRLDFNVLWVEDQPDHVDPQITPITRQMKDEGFNFRPFICRSMDEVRARIAKDVFQDEVDLLLVDYDLGGGVVGQDAIAEIRDVVPYKDVIFYSAMNSAEGLRKLAFDRGLEGVYCASRGELVDEVMGVFDSLVKKVLDIDHTRGIVMGATSDIDQMVNDCLLAMHDKLDGAGKTGMLKDSLGHIEKRIADLVAVSEKLKQANHINDFFEAHMILTAYDRLRLLAGLLKVQAFEGHKQYRDSVVAYQQKAVPGRNILGHLVLVPDGRPEGVVGAEGKVVSLDETRELRRLILGLRGDFRELLLALQA